jgi:hypothetical protein
MTLRSSSGYFLVGMGMHWPECVIGNFGKVDWKTLALPLMIIRLAYFETTVQKHGDFCL